MLPTQTPLQLLLDWLPPLQVQVLEQGLLNGCLIVELMAQVLTAGIRVPPVIISLSTTKMGPHWMIRRAGLSMSTWLTIGLMGDPR